MLKTLASLIVIAMYIDSAIAANYTVGGPNGGWDQATDLQNWASSQTFTPGDNLIFQYTLMHDVTEVSKADYDSCSTSNPRSPPYTGGLTVIPLTSAGKRYFICGTSGHCITGMKVEIDTIAASAPPPTTTPSAPPPSTTTPSAPAPRARTPVPPTANPISPPVSSPLPKMAPASSEAPLTSPTLPPVEAPSPDSLAPGEAPPPGSFALTPVQSPPADSLPAPPPSLATKVNVMASSVFGFLAIFMMLFNF